MSGSIQIFTAVALSLLSAVASARPSTTSMTCEQASDLVASSHAVTLSTGDFTFDRFVDSQGKCELSEMAMPAWVATSDSLSCFIGYICQADRRP